MGDEVSMKITKEWLESEDACLDGKTWGVSVVGEGMEFERLLPKFERADWLLWTLPRTKEYSHRQIVKLACICARRALRFVPSGDLRPEKAIIAAEICIDAPNETTADAARAAARAAAGAAGDAAWAAWAAGDAGDAAGDAAWAAARAAGAAAWAAGDAAWAAEHKVLCEAIRKEMTTKRFKAIADRG